MTIKEIRNKLLKDTEEFDKDLKKGFKGLTGLEKNDIWREGYNHCLWDIKQKINNLDL